MCISSPTPLYLSFHRCRLTGALAMRHSQSKQSALEDVDLPSALIRQQHALDLKTRPMYPKQTTTPAFQLVHLLGTTAGNVPQRYAPVLLLMDTYHPSIVLMACLSMV